MSSDMLDSPTKIENFPGIVPDWPAPSSVCAFNTVRAGGVSSGPWASMNLGYNSGDQPESVSKNRSILTGMLPSAPHFLKQVHGVTVVKHPGPGQQSPNGELEADAQFTTEAGAVCTVLTADCLPVLFCNQGGTEVAAAHAGWRGLASGILERTVAAMHSPPGELLAWLGPAIGPLKYQVGEDVLKAFARQEAEGAGAFHSSGNRWLFDLYTMARHRLGKVGVKQVYGGGLCTLTDSERFYSYRRDGVTGRMASLVWLRQAGTR